MSCEEKCLELFGRGDVCVESCEEDEDLVKKSSLYLLESTINTNNTDNTDSISKNMYFSDVNEAISLAIDEIIFIISNHLFI